MDDLNVLEITHKVSFSKSPEAPIAVEVTRGGMIESIHRGVAVISDSKGGILKSWGDLNRAIYPRSAIKPLQTISVVESGAAEAFNMKATETALACASHSGELIHTEPISNWLGRMGLCDGHLECGPQLPSNRFTSEMMIKENINPSAVHNNCSGKHAGMLTTALHKRYSLEGYSAPDHPVQVQIIKVIEELSEVDLSGSAKGTDGCGIPVFGIPIRAVALAMAKLADPVHLHAPRQEASVQILKACAQNPLMIGGTKTFNSLAQAELSDKAVIKGGAEGVYTAAIRSLGLGICVKIDDGAGRAASVVMLSILEQLGVLDSESIDRIRKSEIDNVRNWSGRLVGKITTGSDFLF
ncbi:MAG: L-asparaginase II [Rhodospirillaceae bacterium]|nr:L-asparaginase II [Rhodospirillaceae bacterium]|tara:strand:- start:1479 stop:2540 length:1062 start_codon:yes stop_codon:yes gene_type:complete